MPKSLLKKRPWHRCFPVNITKFLRTSFFAEQFWATTSECDYVQHSVIGYRAFLYKKK